MFIIRRIRSHSLSQVSIDPERNYELIHLWRWRMKFDRLSGITGRTIVFRSPETSGMLHPLHISISFPSTISISSKCNTALRNEQHTHTHTRALLYRCPNIDSIYLRISPFLSFPATIFIHVSLGYACIEFLGQSCILVYPWIVDKRRSR